MATSKRILSITIKRQNDDSPDTSWLGEYSDKRTSEFSIDRLHDDDCASVRQETQAASDTLQRAIEYLFPLRREVSGNYDEDSPQMQRYYALDSALDILSETQEEITECDCDESGDMQRGEYRYFNPSFNYVDAKGEPIDGNTPEEIRKYVRQDYERMEDINSGSVGFLCIAAVAKIQLETNGPIQKISSGYVCGIESDCDESEFKETEQEQLHELRSQLSAIGFSKRAIATAVKNLVEVE